jgi:predicted DNA-binding protein (MmcQ/YjbR family)
MPASPATDRALQRVRRLCLALPETSEMTAWGHPVFKAGKKTFVALELIKGRPSIAFRLEAVDVDLLSNQGAFFETPYGRGLWASTWADARLNWALVASLVERSYRIVAPKRMLKLLDGERPETKRPPRSAGRPRQAR